MKAGVIWKEKMEFDGFNDKNEQLISISDSGPTAKHLYLQSIVSCTAMDVISILVKMRVEMPESFNVEIEADLTDVHPKVFKNFKVIYFVEGKTDPERLQRAVFLSQERYCGVSEMARKVSDLSYKVIYNGKEL